MTLWLCLNIQANHICFSAQMCETDCPHCHLQVNRSDFGVKTSPAYLRGLLWSWCEVSLTAYAGDAAFLNDKLRAIILLSKQSRCHVTEETILFSLSVCCPLCCLPLCSASSSMDSAERLWWSVWRCHCALQCTCLKTHMSSQSIQTETCL